MHYENTPIQNYRKCHLQKLNCQIKIDNSQTDIFHISARNIDYGYSLELPRRDGSNEYPRSMFLIKIRKVMYTHVNPSWGLRGSKIYRYVFIMSNFNGHPGNCSRFKCIHRLI